MKNGDILVPANPGSLGKMAIKMETDCWKDFNPHLMNMYH